MRVRWLLTLIVILGVTTTPVSAEEADPTQLITQDTARCLTRNAFRSLDGPAWTEPRPQGYRVVWRPIEPEVTETIYEWIDVQLLRDTAPLTPDPMTERWWPHRDGVLYAVHGGAWDPQLAWGAFACMGQSANR